MLERLLVAGQRGLGLVDLRLLGIELFLLGLEHRLGVLAGGVAVDHRALGGLEGGLFLGDAGDGGGALLLQRGHPQDQDLRAKKAFLRLEFLELLGVRRLLGQHLQPRRKFGAQVTESAQVLAGLLDPRLGLAPALLVLADAGGLLQPLAQLVRLGLDHAADHALLDDRVLVLATQAGAEEEIGDVALQALLAVEEVLRIAVAGQLALHRDIGVGGVGADDLLVGVVEDEFHRRAPHRLARLGTVEDHVLGIGTAQVLDAGLAQHPAHRVDQVGLAAAVGADHTREVGRQRQRGGIDEGLEARKLDGGEAHGTEKSLAACARSWLAGETVV